MEKDSLLENKNINVKKIYSYDEAIELTGNGKFQFIVFVLFAASIVCEMIENTSMGYVLPVAKCDLNISVREQGFIGSVGFVGVMLTSQVWGFLADTWGRKKVLKVSMFFTFVFGAISSFSVSGNMMLVFRLAVGLCVSALQPCTVAYLSEIHCNKNRNKYLSKISIFIPLANVLQGLLNFGYTSLGFELNLFDGLLFFTPWRLYILTISFIPFTCFLIVCYLPESPKFLLAQGKLKESVDILKQIHSINKTKSSENYIVTDIAPPDEYYADGQGKPDFMSLLLGILAKPYALNMILLCTNTFIMYFIGYGIFIWVPQIIAFYQKNIDIPNTVCEVLSLSQESILNSTVPTNLTSDGAGKTCNTSNSSFIYIVMIILSINGTIVNTVVGFLMQVVEKKKLLLTFLMTSIVAALVLMVNKNFYLNMLLLSFLTTSCTTGSIITSISSHIFPTHFKSMAISLIIMIGRLGAAFGTNIFGYLITNHCFENYFAIIALMLTSMVLSFYILRRSDKVEGK